MQGLNCCVSLSLIYSKYLKVNGFDFLEFLILKLGIPFLCFAFASICWHVVPKSNIVRLLRLARDSFMWNCMPIQMACDSYKTEPYAIMFGMRFLKAGILCQTLLKLIDRVGQ